MFEQHKDKLLMDVFFAAFEDAGTPMEFATTRKPGEDQEETRAPYELFFDLHTLSWFYGGKICIDNADGGSTWVEVAPLELWSALSAGNEVVDYNTLTLGQLTAFDILPIVVFNYLIRNSTPVKAEVQPI